MPLIRHLLFAALSCLIAFASYGQAAAWNSFHFGKISMKYPPNWQTTKETYKGQARGTLTPDHQEHQRQDQQWFILMLHPVSDFPP